MTDLLPSLMRHQCTTVHHLPYAHIPVTGTSVHTATYPMTIVRTSVPLTTHDVIVDDSNTYDGTFTSSTVLEDSSTYDSATHALVVPSASDQYVITDPTSYSEYDRVRNYSIQYPNGYSINMLLLHSRVRADSTKSLLTFIS